MKSITAQVIAAANARSYTRIVNLSDLLRHTRKRRNLSQLALALRLEVSQRHVSFLESGRTQPSRRLLLAWLDEVGAPPSVRNAALIQGGFSVQGDRPAVSAADTAAARDALRQVLDAHEPFPAFIFTADRYMLEMNAGARRMWHLLMPAYWPAVEASGQPMDMIEATAHPGGLLSLMRQPERAARLFLGLLRSEEWLRPALLPRIEAVSKAFRERYGEQHSETERHAAVPQRCFTFDTAVGTLSFILIQSAFGLPQDITVDSLRIELWFAADAQTRRTHATAGHLHIERTTGAPG